MKMLIILYEGQKKVHVFLWDEVSINQLSNTIDQSKQIQAR